MNSAKIAVIGFGLIGKKHASIIQSHKELELCGIVENNKELINEKDFKCKFFSSIEEIFKTEKIDGAVIATPTPLHVSHAKKFIEKKIPILIEKPISNSLKDASDLLDLAKKKSTKILVLLLGCFLDATTIILVIVPLFIPVCKALGIDLIHFGVLVVVNSMIGLITPPYGILLFVINAVTGIPLKEIISEIWMFIFVLLLALLLMIFFPEIILWVPEMFGYKA